MPRMGCRRRRMLTRGPRRSCPEAKPVPRLPTGAKNVKAEFSELKRNLREGSSVLQIVVRGDTALWNTKRLLLAPVNVKTHRNPASASLLLNRSTAPNGSREWPHGPLGGNRSPRVRRSSPLTQSGWWTAPPEQPVGAPGESRRRWSSIRAPFQRARRPRGDGAEYRKRLHEGAERA